MKRSISALLIILGLTFTPIPCATAATSIGGIATADLVLTKSQSPYVLTSTLEIPAGIKVTIEAGVEIQSNGQRTMFWNQGNLTFKGTRQDPIRLTGKPSLYILTKNAPFGSQLNISGVLFNGGSSIWSSEGYGGYFSLVFEDNEVKDVSSFIYVWYPSNMAVIQRNVFINSGGLSVGFSEGRDISILNNLFIGPSTTGYWIESWASYGGQLEVHNNEFQGGPYTAVQLKPDYKDAKLNATSNYWGTQNLSEISKMVNDRNDSLSYVSVIDVSNPLAQSASGTPTFSILQTDKASIEKAAEKAQIKDLLDTLASQILSIKKQHGESVVRGQQQILDRLNLVFQTVEESAYSDLRLSAEKLQAQLSALEQSFAKEKVIAKKTTITCVKGKISKKVAGINPKCPSGYKKK